MKKVFVIVTAILFLSAVCVTVVTLTAKEPQKKECCKDAQKCDKKDDAKQGCCKEAQKDGAKQGCCQEAQKCSQKEGDKKTCCGAKK